MKITIPKPCHENWDLMTPTEKGRFCAICTKVVRDFTECSDEEIISEITSTEQKICGNFKENQLNRNLSFSFINQLLAKFAVGFVLTSVGLEKLSAQKVCNSEEDSSKIVRLKGDIVIDTIRKIKNPVQVSGVNVIAPNQSNIIIGKIASYKTEKQPLYVLDGKIISEEEFRKINSKKIKNIMIYKDKKAIELYGNKAKYGVIVITLKK